MFHFVSWSCCQIRRNQNRLFCFHSSEQSVRRNRFALLVIKTKEIMEACIAVEREIDKVLNKFGGINEHAARVMRDICNHIENLKKELEDCEY